MNKFKGFLSVLLIIVIISSMGATTFAENTTQLSDAKIVESLGILVGEDSGVTPAYLLTTPNRMQAAIMFLRLKGLESEAASYTGTENFLDATKTGIWARSTLAYLKAHPELGLVGIGGNLYDPVSLMSAQAYYKVMLQTLGYSEGVEFKYEDTIAFAATKGLLKVAGVSNFTVDNLATATVETLKAKYKNSNDTLAYMLYKSGKLTSDQLKLLGAEAAPSPTPTIMPFSTTYNITAKSAKSFSIKFDQAVPNTSRLTFVVSKDTQPQTDLVLTWSSDSTEAILTRADKLVLGSYNVKIMLDQVFYGTMDVNITTEKIVSIEFVPEIVLKINDTTGEVTYVVKNQYGENINSSYLASNITWTTSADSIQVDAKNSKITVVKAGNSSGLNKLRDEKTINIMGIDSVTSVVAVKQLTVSDGFGLIKDFKFLGLVNKNGKTEITVDTNEKFYLDYLATDINGNKIDSYGLLSSSVQIILFTTNSNIAAHIVKDPDNPAKALIEIDTHLAAGVADISTTVLSTGKVVTMRVEIKKSISLSTFVLQPMTAVVPSGQYVEFAYRALDESGNVLTKFEDINNKISLVSSDPLNVTMTGQRKTDGTYALVCKFNTSKQYTLTAYVIGTTNSNTLTVNTSAPPVPVSLSNIDTSVICPAVVENAQIKADFINNPAFKVLDQYGNEFDMKSNNVVGTDYYYVDVLITEPSKIAVYNSSAVAYKDTEIILVGGATRGSATVTFELCKDTDNIPSNGKTVIDSRGMTFTNIEKSKIVSYEFSPIATLYANPAVLATDTYANIPFAQKKEYAADIKIYGRTSSNDRVALSSNIGPGNDILGFTVTDTTKFNVDLTSKKIIAKTLNLAVEANDKLTATIIGANNQVMTTFINIKSSTEIPIAQSIDVILKPTSLIKRSGDTYNCSVDVFNSGLLGKELRKFDSSQNANIFSDLYFSIKDQYGKTALTPSYFVISKTQGAGNLTIDSTTGFISGGVVIGDQYAVTAVTNNGITKTITITIQ